MANTKAKKLGRPFVVEWSKVNLLWKNKTNKEIATILGTSYTNVFLRRKKMVEAAKANGKTGDHYVCKQSKWSRGTKPKATEKVAETETA